MPVNEELIEKGIELVLKGLGCSLKDPNYQDTPERVARMYAEMFDGKDDDFVAFKEEYTDFILLTGHKMFSICPHHLVPVEFEVALAYIPNGKVLGLSKLARILEFCNTGPLLQEKFTKMAVDNMMKICKAKGAACLIRGLHGCTRIRGVRSAGHFTTYNIAGIFKEDVALENRFFQLATLGVSK